MSAKIALLDVVAVTTNIPSKSLLRGQVGTVVDLLAPDRYEVEFADEEGRAYAQAALRADQLIVLRYRPQRAA